MTKLPDALEQFDWRRASWEGARREQMRRWAELPLDRIIAAIEEMEQLARTWYPALNAPASRVAETPPKPGGDA